MVKQSINKYNKNNQQYPRVFCPLWCESCITEAFQIIIALAFAAIVLRCVRALW